METVLDEGVSIITIVLNGEVFIEETIKSVLSQEGIPIQYIIIDGGSKDATVEKIMHYKDQIDCFFSGPDGGIYTAINRGLSMAKYPLIGIIHCGDYYEHNAVVTAYNTFKETGADVVYGDIRIMDEIREGDVFYELQANHLKLKKKMSIFHPSTFVRRSCYLRYGVYDDQYKCAADYDLFLKLYNQKCSFYHVNKVLAIFRNGGLSSSNFRVLVMDNYMIRKRQLSVSEAMKYFVKVIIVRIYFNFRRWLVELIIGEKRYNHLKVLKYSKK